MTDQQIEHDVRLSALDGNTFGWVCACGWKAFEDQPTPERLIELRDAHTDPGPVLHERWYCVMPDGEPRVFWSESRALESAEAWPSMTKAVLHLHGTARAPKIEAIR